MNLSCHMPHAFFLKDSNSAMDTLGQITAYAMAQLGAQFWTHIYSVLIVKGIARILRWNRSGTIVTKPIAYNKSPHLVEFFWCYSAALAAMHGKDETVISPTKIAIRWARVALDLSVDIALVKLSISSPSSGSLRYFVYPIPETTGYTPPGHTTHGFCAYGLSSDKIVFLKDTWRIKLPGFTLEGEVYAKLNTALVCNVPKCVASGDISISKYHTSQTCDYTKSAWACKGCHCHPSLWIPHQHSCLTLNVFGHSLVVYDSSHQMVSAIRDALYGEFY
jgi:hypothetical protein